QTTASGNISTWSDVSGAGNDATQSNAADRPALVDDAINGLPAASFNGSSDSLSLPAGFTDFSSGCSLFVLAKPDSVTSGAALLDLGNGSASDNLSLTEPSSTGLAFKVYNGSTASTLSAGSVVTVGNYQLLEAVYDGVDTATLLTDSLQDGTSSSMAT